MRLREYTYQVRAKYSVPKHKLLLFTQIEIEETRPKTFSLVHPVVRTNR